MEINERDFFKKPFTQIDIRDLLKGKPASEMFNFRSPSFSKLVLDRDKLTDDNLIELMLKEPRLVRRPVVRIEGNVYFGADVKTLQAILD